MKIFLTGATGFIGRHVTPELIAHGHTVLGLTRSDAGARALEAMGAEVVARGLGLPAVSIAPEAAAAEFGWFAMFASLDMPASSAITRERLGWTPTGPGLIADLEAMDY